jgi:hypothetical protein
MNNTKNSVRGEVCHGRYESFHEVSSKVCKIVYDCVINKVRIQVCEQFKNQVYNKLIGKYE